MAKILILGSPRTEEDLTTYDFGLLKQVIGDDGIWNFQDLTHSEPSGTPNNNALFADFDAGSPVEMSSDSYLTDLSEYNFDEMAIDGGGDDPEYDDHKWDFMVPPPGGKDPARIEYEFCNLNDNPELICSNFLRECFQNVLRDVVSNGNIKITKDKQYIENQRVIKTQMFFNYVTNKFFIEYDLNKKFKSFYKKNIPYFIYQFKQYIKDNFRFNTRVWPEIILIEDNKSEIVDDYCWNLTPFTVGYWNSIYGNARFIGDKVQIMSGILGLELKVFPSSIRQELDVIYDTYYSSDIERFYIEYTKTASKYFDKLAPASPYTFIDYINSVSDIRRRYSTSAILTETEKNAYMSAQLSMWTAFHDNIQMYNLKIKELNEAYGINNSPKDQVDSMFNEYQTTYENYFNHPLPVMYPYCFTRYYTVHDILYP